MGAPHNPQRFGELWAENRINTWFPILQHVRKYVTFSGGWAWHFISQMGHPEYKHAHDHKDVDIFVTPHRVGEVISILKGIGFNKVWTRYDNDPSAEDFRRYEWYPKQNPIKLVIDMFVKDVPFIEVSGWKVVEPRTLLSYYGDIHSSDKCWAVMNATKLLDEGLTPLGIIGHEALTQCPSLPVYLCRNCGEHTQFPPEPKTCPTPGCGAKLRNMGKPFDSRF